MNNNIQWIMFWVLIPTVGMFLTWEQQRKLSSTQTNEISGGILNAEMLCWWLSQSYEFPQHNVLEMQNMKCNAS